MSDLFSRLPAALAQATADLGFKVPTDIQQAAIPPLLEGRDVMGLAQTGTGKTAAFGLPLLAAIDPTQRHVQAIVLAPTRELAQQVAGAIAQYARNMDGVDVVAVFGGAPFWTQRKELDAGAQVVVGTPGRVIDHLERGTLVVGHVRFAVLDEADEMLRMGFAEDVDKILSTLPEGRQTALFSATMPPGIRTTAARHLSDPVEVAVTRPGTTVGAVTQEFAVVPFRHKIGALSRVLAVSPAEATIVFCRTRAAAEEVGVALAARGVNAATISGDVPQAERDKIVTRLRGGQVDALVATDVAARGLDVERIGLVVNFDIPHDPDAYVHRVGRTGRAGRRGRALTFVTPHERGKLRTIERAIRQDLTEVAVPTPAEVGAHRMRTLLDQVPERLAKGHLANARAAVAEFVGRTDADPLDLVAALAALAVGDAGPSQAEAAEVADIAAAAAHTPTARHRREAENPVSRGDARRYWVGVGHRDGAQPGAIVGAMTGESGLRGKDLGRIEMFESFSLVEVNHELSAATLRELAGARVAGRALRIRLDGKPDGARPVRRAVDGPRSREQVGGPRREVRSDVSWQDGPRKGKGRTEVRRKDSPMREGAKGKARWDSGRRMAAKQRRG